MKFISLFAAGAILLSSAAFAAGGFTGSTQNAGGFQGPGVGMTSVIQAKKMADDSHVALKGYIVRSLGGELYSFKDESGTINVEIDDDKWMGQVVNPKTLVEIQGEVEKDWGEIKIDVERINIAK